jgi:N6-L-threonylcarbamoyladenine synthase
VIDRLAREGDPTRVPLKAPMAQRGSLEFSFSGLKTQIAERVAHAPPEDEQAVKDLCASFQATATKVLVDKLVAAAQMEGVQDVVVTGGVSANAELRRRAEAAGAKAGLRVTVPPFASCTDNAAMIAFAGACRWVAGEHDGPSLVASSQTLLPRRTHKGPAGARR